MTHCQVLPNRTVRAPAGGVRALRGVTMFDYLFVSFETRADYRYRSILNPAWAGVATGVSEPTYYARICYQNSAYVGAQLTAAWNDGANMIRIEVEPAVMFATSAYVDPVDGNTYPPDFTMLDDIVAQATGMGLVVQLQMTNDNCPVSIVTPFVAGNGSVTSSIVARYLSNPLVWINPWNEPNGMQAVGANVNNAQAWYAKIQPCVSAIRAEGQYLGPIAIDPPGWATRIDLISSWLKSDPTLSDPNLIVNVHYYPQPSDADFRTGRLPALRSQWVNYLASFCVLVGECGVNANGPSAKPPYAAANDFLNWAAQMQAAGLLQGVVGESFAGYPLASGGYDPNAMRVADGSLTTWGADFIAGALSPPAGIAGSGMASVVTGFATGKTMADASVGAPPLQAAGQVGVCASALFATNGASAPYVGFHSTASGACVGQISGDGSRGVLYGTASDERLKTDVTPFDDDAALDMLRKLRPVLARMGDADRHPVFLAHELQAVLPHAVSGSRGAMKDGAPVYQTVDYGRLTPLLAAALLAVLNRLDGTPRK